MDLIFITGTNRGLGRALKEQFELSGWYVITLNRPDFDLSNPDCQKLASLLRAAPAAARTVFLNNAATHHIEKSSQASPDTIAAEVTCNIISPMIAIGEYLRHFPKGEVATITSSAANESYPHWSLYSAAKAAMESYLRSLAAEGFKIHILNPGAVDTDMQAKIRNSDFPGVEKFRDMKTSGKLKSPAFVAKALTWKIIRG